jgi:ABC-2 type transport system permease protein
MTAVTTPSPLARLVTEPTPAVTGPWSAFTTLTRRRFALSAHTPREILVPLLTPILFALVIAPALAKSIGRFDGLDYVSFVAIGTVGLLVPLSCMLGGIAMIVDRQSGALRDLLAAPISRSLIVFGNLAVAVAISVLQVVVLIVAVLLHGETFRVSTSGVLWFVGVTIGIAVAMHSAAEILASRIQKQEEYVGAVPAIAIIPWFFAGAFFSISSLPAPLNAFAHVLPLTHALAVMRYALVDPHASGLRDIWGMSSAPTMAALSLLVVFVFAAVLLAAAVRMFGRSAVR